MIDKRFEIRVADRLEAAWQEVALSLDTTRLAVIREDVGLPAQLAQEKLGVA